MTDAVFGVKPVFAHGADVLLTDGVVLRNETVFNAHRWVDANSFIVQDIPPLTLHALVPRDIITVCRCSFCL